MKATARLVILFLVLALAPSPAGADSLNGSIYLAQGPPGPSVPLFFMFSVSGETFLATLLTFGGGGNGRWFAAVGTTDGASGSGQILSPQSFTLVPPPGASLTFQLDQPGGPTGTFATVGLESVLSFSSGNLVRIFP